MKAGVLVSKPPPGGLGPHHEGVHGAFDVDLPLDFSGTVGCDAIIRTHSKIDVGEEP